MEQEKSSVRHTAGRRSGNKVVISIRNKILFLIICALVVFGIASALLSYKYYQNASVERSKLLGASASSLVASIIEPDRVSEFIAKGIEAEGYLATKKKLQIIKDSSPDIKYVYVYRILPDGCHVVFDLDDDPAGPNQPGDVVKFDESFKQYLPTLLKGGRIEPVITDDTYGWLLTVYTPVYSGDGTCQCYAAVDISMDDLRQNAWEFLWTLAKIFGCVMFAILVAVLALANRITKPINSMAETTGSFEFDNEQALEDNLKKIRSLNIHSGDEVENLYHAFVQMTDDSVQYVTDLNRKNAMIRRMHQALLITLADMVESRDENTGQHIRKTASYVKLILETMKERGDYADQLTKEFIDNAVNSAPLHDIGKINVSDTILNKPGKLTDEEFAIMKTHTTSGGAIIDSIINLMPEAEFLKEAKNLALYHHEKWNGKGYPCGLSGENIPLSARVMAVADVFDALVSKRSYKPGFPYEKALAIIEEERGRHFDPKVVDAFLSVRDKVLTIADSFIEFEKTGVKF